MDDWGYIHSNPIGWNNGLVWILQSSDNATPDFRRNIATHTGVATPELVTFGFETNSSQPRPLPYNGTGVSSSSDDWYCNPNTKIPFQRKNIPINWLTAYWFVG